MGLQENLRPTPPQPYCGCKRKTDWTMTDVYGTDSVWCLKLADGDYRIEDGYKTVGCSQTPVETWILSLSLRTQIRGR